MAANGKMHDIRVPDLAEVSAEYRQAVEQRGRLRARIAELEREENDLLDRLRRAQTVSARDAQALAILGRTEEADTAVREGRSAGRLGEVRTELAATRRALELHEPELQAARREASRRVCETVAPGYRELVARMAEQLAALAETHRTYQRLVDALEGGDVMWTGHMRPMMPTFLGGAFDRQGRVARWLAEAVAYGFIQSVPEELAWPPPAPATLRGTYKRVRDAVKGGGGASSA